jgi:hypothetical protein
MPRVAGHGPVRLHPGCRAFPARRGAPRRAADHRNTERDIQARAAGIGELLPALRTWLTSGPGSSRMDLARRPGTPFGRPMPVAERAGQAAELAPRREAGLSLWPQAQPCCRSRPATRARQTPPGQAITGWMTHLARITCRSGAARTSQPITKVQRISAGLRAAAIGVLNTLCDRRQAGPADPSTVWPAMIMGRHRGG